MFWDKAAKLYDIFEKNYNGDVNRRLVNEVADLLSKEDHVLECACGTGMITKGMAPKCRDIVATDFSDGMLKEATKKCSRFSNVTVKKANIMNIEYADCTFDKIVAGNVIHLLDKPYDALNELLRCCKSGGQVIIPTYVNNENSGKASIFIRLLETFGANFKKQFSFESYKAFFKAGGFEDVNFILVEGKMPCAIAIIDKRY